MDEYANVMSVGHGMLSHIGYEVDADGRERAIYATDWEDPGAFIDSYPSDQPPAEVAALVTARQSSVPSTKES